MLGDEVNAVLVLNGYWVGTTGGLTFVDTAFANWEGYRRPLDASVDAIAARRDSVLVATGEGLAILEDSTFRPVFVFEEPREVYDFVISGSDIYVATDTGVYKGDATDSTRFSLMLRGDARSIHVGETIWVGLGGNENSGQGLRYSETGQSWSAFRSGCIASAQVSSCAFSPVDGKVYMCHSSQFRGFSEVAPADSAVSTQWGVLSVPLQVGCDSRGRVWFAHFSGSGGLSVYDPEDGTWGVVQWGQSSAWNIIDAFGIDEDDTKWVFNGGGVIAAVDSTGNRVEFDLPGLVPPPGGGYDFAFDSQKRVWLGLTVGLVMLDYGGTLTDRADDRHEILVSGLPSSEVRSVAVDGDDNVWVATPQGAAVWDGERFSSVSGLRSDNVYRIRFDGSGRAWFLSEAGLSILDLVSGRWTNPSGGLIPNIPVSYTHLTLPTN